VTVVAGQRDGACGTNNVTSVRRGSQSSRRYTSLRKSLRRSQSLDLSRSSARSWVGIFGNGALRARIVVSTSSILN
jgi:hypothetical protein